MKKIASRLGAASGTILTFATLLSVGPQWLCALVGGVIRQVVSTSEENAMRRVGDLMIAGALIVLTLPFMAIVAIAIKLDSFGPVFYRQERVGLGGRRFMLLKFRSMVKNAEPDGRPVWAAEHDIRITRVGRFIRCTRMDELPQLFNVLCGAMSVVGPRPERPYFVDQITQIIPSFAERHKVKPGITGWAQINYPYGASIEDARGKLSYDLYYTKNRNAALDLVILLSTIRIIIFRWGAR